MLQVFTALALIWALPLYTIASSLRETLKSGRATNPHRDDGQVL